MNKNPLNPFESEQSPDQLFNTKPSNDNQEKVDKPVKSWIERVKGIGIIGSFFVVQFIAGIIMSVLIVVHGEIGSVTSLATAAGPLRDMFTGMVTAEAIMVIILIIIYHKSIIKTFKTELSPVVAFIIKVIGYFGLLWISTIAFSIVDSTLFPQFIEEAGNNQDLIEAALITPSVAMIISICLTAPIVEEFVFRYGIISKLLYGVNRYVAAIIAAVIFSFAHIGFSQMTDPALFIHLMIGYLGQALVFGYIYAREQNLLYPILIHILNNLQAVILIIIYANLA